MYSLCDYLYLIFKENGYEGIAYYDIILKGFYCLKEKESPVSLVKFGQACGVFNTSGTDTRGQAIKDADNNYCITATFKGLNAQAPLYTLRAMKQNSIPTVVVYDLASHLINSSGNITQDENEAFTTLLKAGLEAKSTFNSQTKASLKNLVVLLVNKVNDLPVWFYLNNPTAKIIRVETPNMAERKRMIDDDNFRGFFKNEIFEADIENYRGNTKELEKIKEKFIGATEGLSFIELNGLRNLCRLNNLHISQLPSVVDFYRFGITTNPWETAELKERVKHYDFNERVKGQPVAMNKTLEVVKRAISGMSGIQHSSSSSKPRGVLFFAGPTGTGKTETAKALAELIFRDEKNCIRFDMSEYSQPHSDQRLLGAPPGYVGYEAGGQLTNAVTKHPFSILLFDEIEKAHPSILDKFLQILEDGRMTDGQGKTVYFSECIIIFTSNLGITEEDPNNPGKRKNIVSPDMDYESLSVNVKQGVRNYFYYKLGRPEILNRIGDNVVVFDFIRKDSAEQILQAQIQKICRNIKVEKNISLTLTEKAVDVLKKAIMTNLENGGRGIGNIVESYLVNPLSSYIFDHDLGYGDAIEIADITCVDGRMTLRVSEDANSERNYFHVADANITDAKNIADDKTDNRNIKEVLSAGSEMSMSQKQVNEKEPPAMDNEDNFESFDAFFAKPEPKKISTDDEGPKNIDDFLKK
jgi:DNA polymerase III delta prime subunit